MTSTSIASNKFADLAKSPVAWGLPTWYPPVFKGLLIEVFLLIALGAFVRIMNAGLACPDWPLCFGDYIPDYHPQVYLEFIHRAMAGVVAMTTAVLALVLLRSAAPARVKWLMTVTFMLLMAQVVFGGLTVLLQLHSGVVATHLGMGTAFFALLLWLKMEVDRVPAARLQGARWLRFLVAAESLAVFAQILLGGLVASNYAALVCLDFPKCQGEWFPTFDGMIGLHVMHRLGAYLLFLAALVNWLLMLRFSPCQRLKKWSGFMFALVSLQVVLGISNVLLQTPPIIGVLHLAVATAILGMGVRQTFIAWRTPG